jgi:hypothetical protein
MRQILVKLKPETGALFLCFLKASLVKKTMRNDLSRLKEALKHFFTGIQK